MEKSKLNKFIQKYNLGGNVNSVKWTATENQLKTSIVTPDKSLLGNVKVDKFQFENAELGVYQTDQLKSLIGVLGDDVTLDVSRAGDKAYSLKVKNGSVSVDYTLSDLSVIPDTPKLKRIPEFDTKIKVDSNFMDTFIKGKGALADVETFAITPFVGGLEFVIGYSDINSNRISIKIQSGAVAMTEPIVFNANLFKEVLSANKECSKAILQISNKGLAHIEFRVDDFNAKYWLVSQKV